MELVRSSLSIPSGLPCVTVRSAPASTFSGPAQRSLALWPARSRSRHATLYTEGSDSFVASAAASIATGWSEPVPGREFHPLKSSAFSRRTVTPTAPRVRLRAAATHRVIGAKTKAILEQFVLPVVPRQREIVTGQVATAARLDQAFQRIRIGVLTLHSVSLRRQCDP